jgi:tRNA (guanine26-N2/guanine27-N2)-dimethyltransferase
MSEVEFKEAEYKIISEGKANAYFPINEQVFYNPIQEFNRDLSIAVINTHVKKNKNIKLRILEALAASGIRSMRYALEIENIEEIISNDFDKKAVDLINLNIKLNNVSDKVKSNCGDAISFMHESSKTKFNCIDLDPYGSPTPFLDAAMRSIKNNGLLLVTATDAAVLCGNGVDSCYTKYGAISLRTPFCHELGIRILLQCINSHAIRYSKYIVPLISLSVDFYFRIFLLVFDGQMKAKESATKIGLAYVCSGCQSYFIQKFGNAEPTKNNFKFVHAHSISSDSCINCGGKLHLTGPLWISSLHDKSFVQEVISTIEEKTHLE